MASDSFSQSSILFELQRRNTMTLAEVVELLNCHVHCGEDKLDTEVHVADASDLMSDVLAFAGPGMLLLTGLVSAQSVRTAHIADAKAIVYVRGKEPDRDTVMLAMEMGIPVLSTVCTMYRACGQLFEAGLSDRPSVGKDPVNLGG